MAGTAMAVGSAMVDLIQRQTAKALTAEYAETAEKGVSC
jgi:hypothetical protein